VRRSQKIREVYRELRESTPRTVPSRELLRCAADLVELFDEDTDSSRFELGTGGIPFEQQALDVAFADGGWRVLHLETARRDEALHEEARELLVHNGWARWARELAA
jgi:hypothetical protein